jgi:hypothetical protein
MHYKFDGVEVELALKASCQIVFVIDGGVKAFTHGAGKRQSASVVSCRKQEQLFNDVGYGDFVPQKPQFLG